MSRWSCGRPIRTRMLLSGRRTTFTDGIGRWECRPVPNAGNSCGSQKTNESPPNEHNMDVSDRTTSTNLSWTDHTDVCGGGTSHSQSCHDYSKLRRKLHCLGQSKSPRLFSIHRVSDAFFGGSQTIQNIYTYIIYKRHYFDFHFFLTIPGRTDAWYIVQFCLWGQFAIEFFNPFAMWLLGNLFGIQTFPFQTSP